MGKFTEGMPEQTKDYFSLKEGDNRIRIVSAGAVISEHFKIGVCYEKDKGCKGCLAWEKDQADPSVPEEKKNRNKASYKKMFWVIDRNDQALLLKEKFENPTQSIKLAKFGNKILKALDALANNPDYSFDSFPMPYDITINAKNAGTIGVEYNVVPSPKIVPLTESEKTVMGRKHSTEEIVSAMKKKQAKTDGNFVEDGQSSVEIEYPSEEIDPADIPF